MRSLPGGNTRHTMPKFLRHVGLRIILPVILTGIFLQLHSDTSKAQNRVRILAADVLEGARTEDGAIRKLLGNVKLQTNDFTILCDSAYQFIDLDEIRAFGNIQIEMENETIWADFATYYLRHEISRFEGRVVIKGPNATLFSESATYDFLAETATFPAQIRLEDDEGVLLADSGIYFNELDSAVFRGNVQVADSLQYLEADSLFTNRPAEYYELFGSVFMDDLDNRITLTGRYVEADSTGYRLIEDNSRMRRINEDFTDTTFVQAHKMETWRTDTTYIFKGYQDVEIWTRRYSSLSDTSIYEEHLDLFTLQGNARTWYQNIQLSGPTIKIQLEEDEVHYLLSYTNPFSVQEDTVTGRLNQVTGDTILVHFADADIDFIDVINQSNLLYHTKNEAGEPDGAIEMRSSYTKMLFADGELLDVKSYENIDGTYFPENTGLRDRQIHGFIWEPERRPVRPETDLERRLPDIPPERPFTLPRRYVEFMNNSP